MSSPTLLGEIIRSMLRPKRKEVPISLAFVAGKRGFGTSTHDALVTATLRAAFRQRRYTINC